MLSDEEKEEALSETEIRFRADLLILNSEFPTHRKTEAMEELLEIYNKQSKEIEELKEKTKKCEYYEMVADELYKNSVSEDKIKAILEELQEDIKYSANPLSIDNSKFGIKVLQSLLEKE